MRINNNMMAMNTHRQLGVANEGGAKSMEKLSSGMRINRAGDDAAGLAISEKMRGQIRGLNQASSNAQDGISLIQTAEGALNETHAILQRMRELAVQSSTDTNTDEDRLEIQKEVTQLSTEITRIADSTEFNTKNLLNGNVGGVVDQDKATSTALDTVGVASITTSGAKADTYTISVHADGGKLTMTNSAGDKTQTIANKDGAQELNFSDFGITMSTNAAYVVDTGVDNVVVDAGSLTFHIGANTNQNVDLAIEDMSAVGLTVDDVDVKTQDAANTAIKTVNDAIGKVSSERSKLGAMQNRLEHTIKNLDTSAENLQASEARIRDVDMAKEMMEQTKQNILAQASTAMLANANQSPQSVLQLLG